MGKNMRYANVAFPLSVDQVFTYGVPPELNAVLQPGTRVLAPFRRTRQEGVVVERLNETDLAPNLIKNISDCQSIKSLHTVCLPN